MVQTFLTSSDFVESARSLDDKRLGKERVEAYQILCLIEDLTFLSGHLHLPVPPSRDKLREWIRRIARDYKKKSYRFVVKDGTYQCVNDTNLRSLKSQWNKDGYRVVSLGFVYHPIVQMWFGYSDALKLYINAHIQVWIERGYKNNMKTYSVPYNPPRPPWTYDPKVHLSHRAALLHKEITRHEKPWYQLKTDFLNAGPFTDYIWVLD